MTAPAHTPVSRTEIADCIAFAFDRPPADRSQLIEAASSVHARPEVIATLQDLPERSYASLRQLWVHLPGLPVAVDSE